jgi:hypothetical protein
MLRVVLIDPARQAITQTTIPPRPPEISRLTGSPNPALVWIGHDVRIAFRKEPPGKNAPFFFLPGSPKLFGTGVVFGCHADGTLCDCSEPLAEIRSRVRWGSEPPNPAKRVRPGTKVAKPREKAASGLPRGSANGSVAGFMAKGAGDGAE